VNYKHHQQEKIKDIERVNQKPEIDEGQTIPWPKEQTRNYKTLHRKLKIEQHEPH